MLGFLKWAGDACAARPVTQQGSEEMLGQDSIMKAGRSGEEKWGILGAFPR